MELIDHALAYVQTFFENDYSGHDYFHTQRVFRMATHLAAKEGADLQIVQLAALLHDVDDRKLSPQTYANKTNARTFLKKHHVDPTTIDRICQIIDEISYAGKDSVVPATLEGKCAQDADRLDAIGAIGIARAFAYGGSHNRWMHHPDIAPKTDMGKEEYHNHRATTVNHFYEKLLLLKELMNTNTARQIAQARHAYMQEYLAEFMDEWNGRK